MFLYVVDCPFNFVLLSVKSQLFIVTVFAPSITIPSDAFATNVASFTMISAVEYIDGEPFPVVVYVPPFTFTVPPPISLHIAAIDVPLVFIVKFDAFVVPPPVVIIPPALSPVVVIVESLIVIVVPSLDELFVVADPP